MNSKYTPKSNVNGCALMPSPGPAITRRHLLGSVAAATTLAAVNAGATCPVDPSTMCNVTHLYSVPTAQITPVRDADDIRQALRRWSGRVSVGGGRFSMGGQAALAGGLQLDMRSMRQLMTLDPIGKVAKVQAGMRWRDLQTLLDPHGLSVRTMQSYANFTVGGSISVNCHGRYVGHGSIVHSVLALQLVLADGTALEVSPTQNAELFFAVIGGYGGLGVVTEVTLALDDNFAIESSFEKVKLDDYPAWFKQKVASDATALLHNADMKFPEFDHAHCVTWSRTEKAVTQPARLRSIQTSYAAEKVAIWAMTELPGGQALRRKLLDPLRARSTVVWRNYEASRDVAELEPASRSIATYVLQEYFVPERHFVQFARQMSGILRQSPTGTLNVSIRQAPADQHTLMAWAREDVFCFVVYYKQRTTAAAQLAVADWTRAMIALALVHEGTYYLPYQLHATQRQFDAAYPQSARLRALRRNVGATRFSNALWDKYGV